MRDRKIIEADVTKVRQAQGRLQEELDKLQRQENLALATAGQEILAGAEGKSLEILTAIRTRREGVMATGKAADLKLAELSAELAEISRAEKVQRYGQFVLEFWAGIERLEAAIVTANDQVNAIAVLIQAGEQAGIAHAVSQDFDIIINQSQNIQAHLSGELQAARAQVKSLLARRQ